MSVRGAESKPDATLSPNPTFKQVFERDPNQPSTQKVQPMDELVCFSDKNLFGHGQV